MIIEEVLETPTHLIPNSVHKYVTSQQDLIAKEINNNVDRMQKRDTMEGTKDDKIPDEYGHFETESEEEMEDYKSQILCFSELIKGHNGKSGVPYLVGDEHLYGYQFEDLVNRRNGIEIHVHNGSCNNLMSLIEASLLVTTVGNLANRYLQELAYRLPQHYQLDNISVNEIMVIQYTNVRLCSYHPFNIIGNNTKRKEASLVFPKWTKWDEMGEVLIFLLTAGNENLNVSNAHREKPIGVFRQMPNPENHVIEKLSQELGLGTKQVKNWFYHKRYDIQSAANTAVYFHSVPAQNFQQQLLQNKGRNMCLCRAQFLPKCRSDYSSN
ncbi:hypothetical protein RND71_025072 [Anisodus tanguticus]|uniref:Homeobox domain-containing protein n=1 Tax=Anisodus tanguticus TaxID=243964 RepID=A0AAE1RQT1_9SOLA|nr:hypothetical protein RND71_025072 [Anisodus tanguticus]